MSLEVLLEQLFSRRRFGIKPGVERVAALLERLGNPQHAFTAIHVVGTNGKGSASAFLAAILTAAGYRTAQFSSPHLISFCERFRIDGRDYPEERCEALLRRVLAAADGEETFFEVVTALAALIFREEGVEVAVMEAGMGGRSDATAAIPACMTLLTPVSLDHTEYLGAGLAEIAREKCGIAEPGTPLVSARQPDEAAAVVAAHCRERSGSLYREGERFQAVWDSSGALDYRGIRATLSGLALGIPGRYQQQNAALALAAAELLREQGMAIDASALRDGLYQARWPGRMELVEGAPPILLDGAHNQAGAAALAAELAAATYRHERLFAVLGVCGDKDLDAILGPLLPLVDRWYAVTPAVERGLADTRLVEELRRRGAIAQACGRVAEGLSQAVGQASRDDLVLVCGSLFVVGEARALLNGKEFQGIRG